MIFTGPALPTALSDALDQVTLLFNALFTLVTGILFPATPTALSVLADFGFIFPIVLVILGFVRRLIRGSGD